MDISCAFATSLATPEHIELAERLGYRRAWCFDSPALYADVWMTLALAATRTSVIGLGPAVLVPHLRHVVTNAAAIAHLEALAPGRVAVAVGSGFTGRLAMGQRPMAWRRVRDYVLALRALLRGEEAEWQGAPVKMLHAEGFAAPRPLRVPVLLGISGPRGLAVAEEVGDGIIGSSAGRPENRGRLAWRAQMINGTVLEEGEDPGSPRALAAAGHGAALAYHLGYEMGRPATLPRGAEFAAAVNALPARTRHLVLHERHLVGLNSIDQAFVDGEMLARTGRAASSENWRARLAQIEQDGVSELIYQPAGTDIGRELQAFAEVAGLETR